jgi:hypothetical protein
VCLPFDLHSGMLSQEDNQTSARHALTRMLRENYLEQQKLTSSLDAKYYSCLIQLRNIRPRSAIQHDNGLSAGEKTDYPKRDKTQSHVCNLVGLQMFICVYESFKSLYTS